MQALAATPGWTWNPYEDDWEKGYRALQRFAAREDHSNVPPDHQEGTVNLGQWIRVQRAARAKDSLSETRRRRLEQVPGWMWVVQRASWDRGLRLLRRYRRREGNALVPSVHVEDGFRLGSWVNRQRRDYKWGTLLPERRQTLEAVDGWCWDELEQRWNAAFERLQRFVAREGHARVPREYVEAGYPLGRWVDEQRQAHRRRRLSTERRRRLTTLRSWTW